MRAEGCGEKLKVESRKLDLKITGYAIFTVENS